MNTETLHAALEGRSLWILIGIVAFFLWNNLKGDSEVEEKRGDTQQAAKNDAKIKVTEDFEGADSDWAHDTPSVNVDSQIDAFSESVKQESDTYANDNRGGEHYKGGVDI